MALVPPTQKNRRVKSLSADEKLSTLDEYGSRLFVIPAEVKGRLRSLRDLVYWGLLAIFIILPWTKINGMQSVWINVPERRFALFGITFFAHDVPLIFFILAIGVLGLALVTALWGRVWCGWACPQTVFIDAVYRRIEIWVEGDYITRRRRHQRPLDIEKFSRSSLKWLAYIVVSSVFAHSFVAYFTGAQPLLEMMKGSPEQNWTYFLLTSSMTLLLLFNFGWFREQFCLIMCPYGRFQSVLMDEQSVTVLYDEKRGEPRKNKTIANQKQGDCVSCNRCVQVCPTNIDIRNGVQMECIACTACIDACNEIMRKVNKPEGLIRYQNLKGFGTKYLRPRVLVYFTLIIICSVGLAYNVIYRQPFASALLRAKDSPYQTLPDDKISNHFKLHLHNQSSMPQQFELQVEDPQLMDLIEIRQAEAIHHVQIGDQKEFHFFVIFSNRLLSSAGDYKLKVKLIERISQTSTIFDLDLLGPKPISN